LQSPYVSKFAMERTISCEDTSLQH
jgi:hypothetical protein